jgi:hypothetical protein
MLTRARPRRGLHVPLSVALLARPGGRPRIANRDPRRAPTSGAGLSPSREPRLRSTIAIHPRNRHNRTGMSRIEQSPLEKGRSLPSPEERGAAYATPDDRRRSVRIRGLHQATHDCNAGDAGNGASRRHPSYRSTLGGAKIYRSLDALRSATIAAGTAFSGERIPPRCSTA